MTKKNCALLGPDILSERKASYLGKIHFYVNFFSNHTYENTQIRTRKKHRAQVHRDKNMKPHYISMHAKLHSCKKKLQKSS